MSLRSLVADFISEARKPFNAVTFIGLVLTTALAIYFYYAPQQHARLSYRIDQITIYEPPKFGSSEQSFSAPFSVIDANGSRITTGIYAATIVVWNSGDLELGKDKVRRPFTVTLPGESRILYVTFDRVSDENVSEFEIVRPTPDRQIQVVWRYLDPLQAFKLRIFYSSDAQQAPQLSATILGVAKLQSPVLRFELNFALTALVLGGALAAMAASAFSGLFTGGLVYRYLSQWINVSRRGFVDFITFSLAFFCGLGVSWIVWRYLFEQMYSYMMPPPPPFT